MLCTDRDDRDHLLQALVMLSFSKADAVHLSIDSTSRAAPRTRTISTGRTPAEYTTRYEYTGKKRTGREVKSSRRCPASRLSAKSSKISVKRSWTRKAASMLSPAMYSSISVRSLRASKWNKIEHRLFSFITHNWRGQPLISHQAIVSLIASTTTRSGLVVRAALDTNQYATKIKVSDEQLAQVRIKPHDFHGEWNYTISPRR